MPRRAVLLLVISLAFAALCARLGVWQLHRLAERRARNAELASRLGIAPVAPAELPADTAHARFRRVTVAGTFDFDHEIYLTGRSLNGSPGVFIVTPMRQANGGPAVLVQRGWVYSPDAATIDPQRWLEPERRQVTGYVDEFRSAGRGPAVFPDKPLAWRWLDGTRLASAFPYPIAPYYVVDLGDSAADAARRDSTPARLGLPAMDEGPHRGYAIQWFSFAAIALYGAAYLLWYERRRARAPEAIAPSGAR